MSLVFHVMLLSLLSAVSFFVFPLEIYLYTVHVHTCRHVLIVNHGYTHHCCPCQCIWLCCKLKLIPHSQNSHIHFELGVLPTCTYTCTCIWLSTNVPTTFNSMCPINAGTVHVVKSIVNRAYVHVAAELQNSQYFYVISLIGLFVLFP